MRHSFQKEQQVKSRFDRFFPIVSIVSVLSAAGTTLCGSAAFAQPDTRIVVKTADDLPR